MVLPAGSRRFPQFPAPNRRKGKKKAPPKPFPGRTLGGAFAVQHVLKSVIVSSERVRPISAFVIQAYHRIRQLVKSVKTCF